MDLFERIHLSGSIIVDSFALILQLQVKDNLTDGFDEVFWHDKRKGL